MKTDVENLSSTRVKIVVEIPFEELTEDLKDAYRAIASQANVPGFRKGKVPPRVIDQRFGRGTVLSEVANAVIPRMYEQVVEEKELVPLGQPKVEVTRLEDGELIEFVAEVDVRPEFELPDLGTVTAQVEAIEVADDAVASELLELRKRFATFVEVDRAAEVGDALLLDVAAADEEGNPVEAYSATSLSYEVGAGSPIDGLDEAVAGAVADDERSFEHTPTDGEFEGKELTVTVTVKAVRERELPDADDEFAALASEFDTIAELEADVVERVRRAALYEQGASAQSKVRQAFLDLIEMDLPDQLIADQLDEHFADGHGDDDHRAETEQEMRNNLKANLALDKLAEERDVRVEQSELSQWLISQAARYGMSPDQFANALVEAGQVQSAIAEVRRAKALSLVVAEATITDTDGNPVDLDAISRLLSGQPEIDIDEVEDADDAEDDDAEDDDAQDDEAADDDAEDADTDEAEAADSSVIDIAAPAADAADAADAAAEDEGATA